MAIIQIDLGELTDNGKIHNLAGKERGEQARTKYELDKLDREATEVVVTIPDHVYALSSSFFLGLFSPTVSALGDEAFKEKYRFSATPVILQQVHQGISRCVSSRASLH